MSEIKNKKILITGATGGLGEEMVKAFLNEGGHLILSDLNQASLDAFVSKYKSFGTGKILGTFSADLSTEEGCDLLVKEYSKFGESPDILVNNAGIAILGPFSSVPRNKWEKILNINLLAPMRITHSFLTSMLARKSGHIVNVSSVAGLVAAPSLNAYCVSKFGIKAFGESLSQEVASSGLKVTNFYPFFTRTPILKSEQIGVNKELSVPDFLLSEPDDVIRDLMKGIKNDSMHVHPGGIAKTVEFVSRFLPGLLSTFSGALTNSKSDR